MVSSIEAFVDAATVHACSSTNKNDTYRWDHTSSMRTAQPCSAAVIGCACASKTVTVHVSMDVLTGVLCDMLLQTFLSCLTK
jgi:hypothetical protein